MKLGIATVAVLSALVLAGCSNGPSATSYTPADGTVTQGGADQLAQSICDAFGRGMDKAQAYATMRSSGVGAVDAVDLVHKAVEGYCPQYLDRLN